ncbi:YbdD/YjiX family protein [Rothia kristinae]|uniref:YbdD/YjiX family protein n=2 Tax=Rothia kristinae TaxID=37923 RepID=A0A7T4MVX5_9MICC|nr:YbdD/YjiX family protein [Rothia kristinae]QQC60522.1 YbdD/YjiX family protein [Rothia kristinae]
MGLLGRLRESAPVRFASGVLGADKYRGYLEYHRRAGLTDPPMTEREYWRHLAEHQEAHPQGRCC